MINRISEARITCLIFLLFAMFYLMSTTAYSGGGDLRYSVATAKALVGERSLNIDNNTYSFLRLKPEHSQDGIGWYYHNRARDKSYSRYGIGIPAILMPYVFAAEQTAGLADVPVDYMVNTFVSFYNVLFGAGVAVLIYLFSRSMGSTKRASLWMTVFLGAGTMLWRYSGIQAPEIAQTFFLLLAVHCAVKGTPRCLVLGGIALAFLVLIKVYYVVFVPLFLLFIYVNEKGGRIDGVRALLRFSPPIFVAGVVILYLNQVRFGDMMNFGAGGGPGHEIYFSVHGMLDHMLRLLFSRNKGLFLFNPVLVPAVFAFIPFIKKYRQRAFFFMSIIGVHLLLISSYSDWHGDWAWGPRYLVPVIPLIGLPMALIIFSGRKYIKGVLICSFLISVAVQSVSVVEDPSEYHWLRYNLRYQSDVPSDHRGSMPVDMAGNLMVARHKIVAGDNIYKLSEFGEFSGHVMDTRPKGFKRWNFLFYHLAVDFDRGIFLYLPFLLLAGVAMVLAGLLDLTSPAEQNTREPR
jgi:hypothetical protein